MEKREDQRVQFVNATDIFDVGIQLIPQADIQSQLRMHSPVILHKARDVGVACIRNQQRFGWLCAAYRDGENQIVIVDSAIAGTIEVWKVFDHFDTALLENSKIEVASNPLNFTAEFPCMIAVNQNKRIAELKSALLGSLGHAKRSPILNAGKRELWPYGHGSDLVVKVAETETEGIKCSAVENVVEAREERMCVVPAFLSFRCGTDRTNQRAGSDVIFSL